MGVELTINPASLNILCITAAVFLFLFTGPNTQNLLHFYSSVLWLSCTSWLSLAAHIYKYHPQPKIHVMFGLLPAIGLIQSRIFFSAIKLRGHMGLDQYHLPYSLGYNDLCVLTCLNEPHWGGQNTRVPICICKSNFNEWSTFYKYRLSSTLVVFFFIV